LPCGRRRRPFAHRKASAPPAPPPAATPSATCGCSSRRRDGRWRGGRRSVSYVVECGGRAAAVRPAAWPPHSINVAVVKVVQVVRIKPIPEVCGETERLERARFPEAAGDGAVAVDLLPGALVTGGELLDRHVQRFEDDVLAVVELPVAGEDAVLLREALMQRSAG